MKKFSIILIVAAIGISSCTLADSGRKAALQISFSQPEIFSSNNSGSERIIPAESDRIEIILYQPFKGDPLSDSTLDQLDASLKEQILSREGSVMVNLSLSSSNDLSKTLGDLEPGLWNILVGTFDENSTEWTGGRSGTLQALTYRFKPAVKLQTGMNFIDMPLKLNVGIFSDTIVDSADEDTYADINGQTFTNYSVDTSIAVSIIGTVPATGKITYVRNSNIPISNIQFYDTAGHKLDLPFFDDTEPYWKLDGTKYSSLVIVAFCPDYPEYTYKHYTLTISPLEVYDITFYPDIDLEFRVVEEIIG